MKHTDQRFLSLAALALSALLLTGCGDGGAGGGGEETTGGAGTSAPAEPTGTEGATAGDESASATATGDESASATPSGTATADESASASPSGTATSTSSPGAGDEAAAVAGAVVAAEEAVTGGQVFEIDRKDDDGGWEIKLAVGDREKEVDVSQDGSEVTPQEGDDQLDQEDRERIAQVQVPMEVAVRAALDEVDGTLDGAQLDTEDGTTVWEVDIDDPEGTSVDVYVNVANGSVVKVDR
ncbi:PepSY domain-containing protein [Kocuria nitroreducens]|uniref:PepSY domain-containing protein n=1 Tax=Kocuria nitroreducens TaxID=3058914 RepID=UPI0036D888E3